MQATTLITPDTMSRAIADSPGAGSRSGERIPASRGHVRARSLLSRMRADPIDVLGLVRLSAKK